MSFHHLNRLLAHYEPKNLTLSARVVAVMIAHHLNAESNSFPINRKWIAAETGLGHGSIDQAVKDLEEIGYFASTRKHSRSPKVFSLSLKCPDTCHAKEHRTGSEAFYEMAVTSPSTQANLEPIQESTSPSTQANLSPSSKATYRDSYKDLDEDLDKQSLVFENLIRTTLKKITNSGAATLEHLALEAALDGDGKDEVLAKAKAVVSRATSNPSTYLKATITKSPLSLYQLPEAEKPSVATSEPATKGKARLKSIEQRYYSLTETKDSLLPWAALTESAKDFLERVSRSDYPVVMSAAVVASIASNENIPLDWDESVDEAAFTVDLMRESRAKAQGALCGAGDEIDDIIQDARRAKWEKTNAKPY
jgi:hypothetical protein